MSHIRIIYGILAIFFSWSCASHNPPTYVKGEEIRGNILDGELGEILIGLTVHEFNRPQNQTITDTVGNFKLTLKDNYPIITLSGFYKPILVEIQKESFNKIVINKETLRKSRELKNKFRNL